MGVSLNQWNQMKIWINQFERSTRPVAYETREALERRWASLPDHIRTDSQTLGRMAVGCEGTHGVFPRCNFACTPCYHSAKANQVRVDGPHTLIEIERQMSYLASERGPHAHAQLIGGEVTLLPPDDHAKALQIMRDHGREPMSFTHGDMDYPYLKELAIGNDGQPRFKRLSFAGHFDTTMRGRRGLRIPTSEAELNSYRQAFCDLFKRLRKEYGVRYFLAHNMTVIPSNVDEIPQVIRDCHAMGFNMMSFQPAAFVGNSRRWKEDYTRLEANLVWDQIEAGAGTRLPYQVFQTGDERCNRSAFGYYVGKRWFPVLDENNGEDLKTRYIFYEYLGGIHWGAPLSLLLPRLARVLASHPHLVLTGARWLGRQIHKVGGIYAVALAIKRHELRPMTFVMHRFMNAEDVQPAWEMLKRGEMSTDPRILETQERLQSCFYAMSHPETGEIVPACVQHGVLDPAENGELVQLLPLPKRRSVESCKAIGSQP